MFADRFERGLDQILFVARLFDALVARVVRDRRLRGAHEPAYLLAHDAPDEGLEFGEAQWQHDLGSVLTLGRSCGCAFLRSRLDGCRDLGHGNAPLSLNSVAGCRSSIKEKCLRKN